MKLNSTQAGNRHRRRVLSIRLHFIMAAAFVVLCTALPAFGQTATYSDSWFVDNSPETYDASIDAYSANVIDAPAQHQVAGVGVTEADYYTDSQSVQTTLTAPNGTSATATQYSDPWYSRAEVTLPYTFDVNAPPGNEVAYTVDTAHRYYQDPYGGDDGCNQDPSRIMQPCYIAKASSNSAAPGFFYIFTRFIMTISIRVTSYRLSSISPSRCIYAVDCPEGYRCGYRSIYYYPRGGGPPCLAYAVMGNLLINRTFCINSVYGYLSPVPVPCT